MNELKPCPMCGGPAEMDTLRGYRRWSDGSVGNAIAVYCTECTLEISVCRDDVPDIEPEQVAEMWNRRAQPAAPADAAPSVAPEPVAWEGGEGWESLAWELCADENGEDACNELIWEGGPIPEPWGDRWMKYEGEAKRLIALVHKHAAHPPRAPLSLSEISDIVSLAQIAFCLNKQPSFKVALAREVEAAHGINAEGEKT